MEHFLVFIFLIIFLCGSWVAFAVWQQYKATGILLFRRLLQYVISFNLLVFSFFVATYSDTNLIGEDPLQHDMSIWIGAAAVTYVLQTSVAWTILRLAWEFKQRKFPRLLAWIFLAAITLVGISYVISGTVIFEGGSPQWLVRTYQAMSIVVMLAFVYALLGLIAGRHTNLNADQRKSALRFGWLLLAGFLVIPASLALPRSMHTIGFAVGLFWMSCSPFVWLRRHSGPFRQAVAPEAASSAIAALAMRHGITQREQEVMALLVEGKSNKEIEDSLCISFSTVKNHVYNLYKKLDVKSRAQLIHLVMVEGDRREP